MSISFVLITFLLQMSVGMVVTVTILPTSLIDNKFFKSINFWSFLFTAIAFGFQYKATFHLPELFGVEEGSRALWIRGSEILFFFFGAMTFAQWFHLRWLGGKTAKGLLLLTSAVGILALLVDSFVYRPMLPPEWVHLILIPLHFLSASFVLGAFLAGMIFGHHYLVSTEMPKRLLVTMAWTLIGAMVFRIFSVGASLLSYAQFIYPDKDFLMVLTSFSGHGIFFWQRVLVGLFVPSLVVGLIWNTARIGSNQSATGIMYVAISFVFIGELAARYLFLISAIPL